MKWLVSFALILFSVGLHADVVAKGETGFNLKIVDEVSVWPQEAYDQFVRVDEWWLERHSWFGSRKNFSLETKAGGCFCEIKDDQQVLHMLVTFVNPGEEIKMVGGLGPLQMMGLTGGMSWRFEALENGEGTRIIQTYNVNGWAPGGLLDLAEIVDAVQTSQLKALVARINDQTS
ncbi:MAG: hypothetical protein JJ921_08650 [Pseudomonadales bacterium]|nr:hypothetical protein [Pseudomonadales bacterium]MBO6566435.1 hypothetical protein [Pseudomonadales bacterium]MBO6595794.1 hypothetical protein [Pseudomonadales bacterium]MBO6702399.1 hypothetical protein [Pseudomonadales bacterium]MBO6822278.1 hypothetical protein [Pseudomonadales bacterium]